MAEHQVIVALVERALEVAVELAAEPIGHRQGATAAAGAGDRLEVKITTTSPGTYCDNKEWQVRFRY
jgi:hypothetical protein